MHLPRSMITAYLGAAALLLSGCGGGGSTGVSDADALQPVVASALPMSADSQETGRALDVAVDGEGLLVGHDPLTGERIYTRWGRLDVDDQGHLVHAMGWRMGGVPADEAAAPAGQDLSAREAPLPAAPWALPPRPSSRLLIGLNIDAGHPQRPGGIPFDPDDVSSYDSVSAFTVIDGHGLSRILMLYFRDIDSGECTEVHARVDGLPVEPNAGTAWHRLCHQADGTQTPASRKAPPLVVANRSTAVRGQPAPDLGQLQVLFDSTHVNISFGVTRIEVDGYGAGFMRYVSIAGDGMVSLQYSNGISVAHGRLVLAKPSPADRFLRAGSVGWHCAAPCATPTLVQPGQRLSGLLQTGRLATHY